MSRYKQELSSIAEAYKDYGYDELLDADPYVTLGLLFALDNPKHFSNWIDSSTQFNKDEILFEALNSLAKRFLGGSIYRPDFDDIIYEYAVHNSTIEADYELAREEIVGYDSQHSKPDPDEQREEEYDDTSTWSI